MLRKIHLWLSIPFGIIITLICFSGAMLVFEKEISAMVHSRQMSVEPHGRQPLPADSVATIVARTLPQGVAVTGITISNSPTRAYEVGISQPRHASVLVNQYTGQVLGTKTRGKFFSTMLSLHRWLLDSGRPQGRPAWGKIVVGVSTIMMVVALLTGLWLWRPRSAKALRQSLTITARHGRHRLWRGLHVAGGVYATLLLLAMALTGLTWSFDWYNRAFYAAFGLDAPVRSKAGRQGHEAERQHPQTHTAWQTAYQQVAARHPHAPYITVGPGTATVPAGTMGNTRATHRYTFCTATGDITSHTPYEQAAPHGKLRGWIYAVHTGTFGGIVTRLLWMLAALMGATLPITGYYLWIRRLVKRRGIRAGKQMR